MISNEIGLLAVAAAKDCEQPNIVRYAPTRQHTAVSHFWLGLTFHFVSDTCSWPIFGRVVVDVSAGEGRVLIMCANVQI